MKKLIILINVLWSIQVMAQQQPTFTTTLNSPHLLNFAFAGTNEVAQIDLVNRMQWLGHSDNINTVLANGFVTLGTNKGGYQTTEGVGLYSSPSRTLGVYKHVVGGMLYNDRLGLINQTVIRANYAIHLPVTKKLMVSATLGIGYGNLTLNRGNARVQNQQDALLPQIAQLNQSLLNTSVGIGLYTEKLTFGFGIEQAIPNRVEFNDTELKGRYIPHYTATISYAFQAGKITIAPQAIYRFNKDLKSFADFGIQLQYNHSIWLGLYGRTTSTLMLQVGANLFKRAYLSYGIDIPVGKLVNVNSAAHEIRLGIYIGKKEKSKQENVEVNQKVKSEKSKVDKEKIKLKFEDEDTIE